MRLLAFLALAACSPPGTAAVAAPTAASSSSLPAAPAAGIYWVPYKTCPTCEAPAALAAYLVRDVAAARTIANKLEGTLALGLPFVVHADEIGVSGGALVVAVGAYPRRADAELAARAAPEIAGHRAEVVALAESEGSGETSHHVVRIDRGAPVPAWSAADVEAVGREADESTDPALQQSEASRRRWIADRLHARTPACTVAPGDLFVVEESELRWYEYAPVRCGGAPAYVAWTASLLGHAAVVREERGYRLYQVIGAQCDSPIIESWPYDARGRRLEPDRDERDGATVIAGC